MLADVDMIEEMVQLAMSGRGNVADPALALCRLFRAYEQVLRSKGIDPQEDSYYYGLLLKVSCEPPLCWTLKLHSIRHVRPIHQSNTFTFFLIL